MGALARVIHVWISGTWLGALVFALFLAPPTDVPVTFGVAAPSAAMWLRFSWCLLAACPVLLVTLFIGWGSMQVVLRARTIALLVAAGVGLLSVRWLAPAWEQATAALSRVPAELPMGDSELLQFTTLSVYVTAAALLQGALAFYLVGAAMLARKKRQGLGGGIEL